jgi:hypothetical protein
MVSLNDINEEVDEKYAPFVVEGVDGGDVVLRNAIRLTDNERHQLFELDSALKKAKEAGTATMDSALEHATSMLKIVGVGDGGERLVAALEGDPAKLLHVMRLYTGATQPGEASRSES